MEEQRPNIQDETQLPSSPLSNQNQLPNRVSSTYLTERSMSRPLPPPSLHMLERPPTITITGRPGQVCAHCSTTISPLWRRTDRGEIVCNACGLYYKNRGQRRPMELKIASVKRKRKLMIGSGMAARKRLEDEIEMDSKVEREVLKRRKALNPLRTSKLPLTSLNDILTGFRQAKFRGKSYYTGDVVAVRGNDGQDYYAVISGFSILDTEKYFQCFWLVPKPSSFLIAHEWKRPLTPFDYELFIEQEYRLPMGAITDVLYSPADMFVSEQEMYRDPNKKLQRTVGEGTPLRTEEKDAADALLLVRLAHTSSSSTP
jgi:uncharacterized Zn finger protein (UPF0148 family)